MEKKIEKTAQKDAGSGVSFCLHQTMSLACIAQHWEQFPWPMSSPHSREGEQGEQGEWPASPAFGGTAWRAHFGLTLPRLLGRQAYPRCLQMARDKEVRLSASATRWSHHGPSLLYRRPQQSLPLRTSTATAKASSLTTEDPAVITLRDSRGLPLEDPSSFHLWENQQPNLV